jgi:outer membrane protein assembly factor BamB
MMNRVAALACLVTALSASSPVVAEDLSYFRGDRGLADDDNRPLPERFDTADVLLWRQPLAPGHSTPCVSGDAIYLTTFDEGRLNTVALNRETGKVRWSRQGPSTEIEPFHPTGSPAVATIACDRQRVYSFFGSFGLLCYDLHGQLVWSKAMGPFQDEFGAAGRLRRWL